MPRCAKTAELMSAGPVIEAVCEAAARTPYSERPIFSRPIPRPLRVAASAAAAKRGPSLTPSTSVSTPRTSGWRAK